MLSTDLRNAGLGRVIRPRAFRMSVGQITLLAALAAAAFCAAGCEAMRNPEDSDLPWAESHSWETQPALPQSMLN